MVKLIKKNTAEALSEEVNPLSSSAPNLAKSNIIDRDSFAARSEAQQIREQAQAQAEALIAEAHAQAQEILKAAESEANARKQAKEQEGYAAGEAAAALKFSEVLARLAKRVEQFEAQAIPQLKDLALVIVRKILGKELEFSPESIVSIIKQVLADKARQRREICLRIHPDDLAILREHKADLLEVLSRVKDIGLQADPEVARYGVIIETDAGVIDAQLETQLAVFEKILKSVE